VNTVVHLRQPKTFSDARRDARGGTPQRAHHARVRVGDATTTTTAPITTAPTTTDQIVRFGKVMGLVAAPPLLGYLLLGTIGAIAGGVVSFGATYYGAV
jgi:hypothetical protein